MRIERLSIEGAYRVVADQMADHRGFFARTVCEETFIKAGLVGRFSQSSISFNIRRGTVRGMHFAVSPHAETKLVRCTAGAVQDVLLDLRPESPTYRRTTNLLLSAQNRDAVYIPTGVAHGFQTLAEATELLYLIDTPYVASAARGVRWDDPAFTLEWPEPIAVISPRDLAFPDWAPEAGLG